MCQILLLQLYMYTSTCIVTDKYNEYAMHLLEAIHTEHDVGIYDIILSSLLVHPEIFGVILVSTLYDYICTVHVHVHCICTAV